MSYFVNLMLIILYHSIYKQQLDRCISYKTVLHCINYRIPGGTTQKVKRPLSFIACGLFVIESKRL